MDASSMLKQLDRIKSLPTLPVIVLQVNNLLQDENTTIQQLQETIEKDQAIVPKILNLVNSSFFGLRSKISNLSHAIILLGFNPIRNAVLSVSVVDAFARRKTPSEFNITHFWSHSVAVAVISKYLAQANDYPSPEDAFTGGLVHDIGKLVLCQFFEPQFKAVWSASIKNGRTFYETEKTDLPLTHPRIGSYLARKWNLPQRLIDTIRYHHAVRPDVADATLLMIIHTANQIVNQRQVISDTSDLPPLAVDAPAAETLAGPLSDIDHWYPQQALEIESACEFFLQA